MTELDDLKTIEKYDKERMLAMIESFPEQCADAKTIASAFRLPAGFRTQYKNIVFTGLGGSAIGADLARSYVADEAGVPILVNRNYLLPQFVDGDSLVVVSSYSGNTEEILSAYKDARSKKASIIAVTSGGELERLAKADNVPHLIIAKGFPPRCALGYAFVSALILLSKVGVIADKSKELEAMIDLLKGMNKNEIGQKVPESKNIAKRIAKALYRKYPIIYGGQDHIDAVVTRWRGQIAENSKTLASSHVFPEMNHNEIVGWENPKELLKDLVVIILRDSADHPRTSKRMDITKEIIESEHVKVLEVPSSGKGLLSRIFSLVYTGDLVSFYLAILNKCDPTPVERVTYLKNELAKG